MTTNTAPRWHLACDPDTTYPAVRYATPWDGWACPVVDRATLVRMLDNTGEPYTLTDTHLSWGAPDDDPSMATVDADGLWRLAQLGITASVEATR